MPKIIFVYNADSGAVNGLVDLAHKTFSPSTYRCNLCAVTYNTFGMRSEWKSFVDELTIPVEFLHRDELEEEYGISDVALPTAFLEQEDGRLTTWIDPETMGALESLDELKSLVERKLEDIAG